MPNSLGIISDTFRLPHHISPRTTREGKCSITTILFGAITKRAHIWSSKAGHLGAWSIILLVVNAFKALASVLKSYHFKSCFMFKIQASSLIYNQFNGIMVYSFVRPQRFIFTPSIAILSWQSNGWALWNSQNFGASFSKLLVVSFTCVYGGLCS